ncbi:hypothetical protein [Paraburkholderia phenazinium]|uniref:hypothetical protein n=1 Tax=Paraburkholderia phenazinium TaxID=60549 RepID=UPI00158EFC28|nr:hypothetical protein [Paraburkholderia phenazinium]
MARVGAYVTVEVDGEQYRLSPHEMPGEIEWRIDFIRWLISRALHQVSALPRTQRMKALIKIEDELIHRTNLHPIEARAVIGGTLWALQDLPEDEMWALERAKPLFEARVRSEGEALMSRYLALVQHYGRRKGPESLERNPDAGPAEPSDWNWSVFLDW